jgi:hypothetical protein
MIDMNRLPYVQAKWFTPVDPSQPRRILWLTLHDMEFPEKLTAAEDVAMYFHTLSEKLPNGKPKKASAHTCWDNNSAVRCVLDKDVAYAAPGANSNGLQYELAGYGRQTRDEWLDEFGRSMIALVCDGLAQDCIKYGIPPIHLTNAQLAAGQKGIIGHYQASEVWQKSDHTDPGKGFPWDVVILNVGLLINQKKGVRSVTTPHPGERRWSGYFTSYVELVQFRSDTDWTFLIVNKPNQGTAKAQTAWSKMPLKNPAEV